MGTGPTEGVIPNNGVWGYTTQTPEIFDQSTLSPISGPAGVTPSGDTSGVTDQARIAAAISSGQTFALGLGKFYFNAPLVLPKGFDLNGSGRPYTTNGTTFLGGTQLIWSSLDDGLQITNSVFGAYSATIRNLGILQTNSSNAGAGINATNASNLLFENVTMGNCWDAQIISNGCETSRLLGVKFWPRNGTQVCLWVPQGDLIVIDDVCDFNLAGGSTAIGIAVDLCSVLHIGRSVFEAGGTQIRLNNCKSVFIENNYQEASTVASVSINATNSGLSIAGVSPGSNGPCKWVSIQSGLMKNIVTSGSGHKWLGISGVELVPAAATSAITGLGGWDMATINTKLFSAVDGSLLTDGSSATNQMVFADGNNGTTAGLSLTPGLADQPFSINTQTGTTYTLVLGDAQKLVTLNNASAITLTIDTNANVAFSIGTFIGLAQLGAGQVHIVGAGGVTINSAPGTFLRAQYSMAGLVKTGTDTWLLTGDLST